MHSFVPADHRRDVTPTDCAPRVAYELGTLIWGRHRCSEEYAVPGVQKHAHMPQNLRACPGVTPGVINIGIGMIMMSPRNEHCSSICSVPHLHMHVYMAPCSCNADINVDIQNA